MFATLQILDILESKELVVYGKFFTCPNIRINDLNNLLFLGDDFVGIEFKNLNQEEMIEIKNSKCLL